MTDDAASAGRGWGCVVRVMAGFSFAVVVLLAMPLGAAAAVPNTERASVSTSGEEGDGGSPGFTIDDRPSISVHGRYVAFTSEASNLVNGDSNGVADVFLRDRVTGTTLRVSVSTQGVQANGASSSPSISSAGRYVAFTSDATNLVPRDTNGKSDVFVRDRVTGKTTRVSVRADGGQANGRSSGPSISADGRYVAFASTASKLVGGDTNGPNSDVFVRDRVAGTTERINLSDTEQQALLGSQSQWASISGDGRYVAFQSDADNLVAGDDRRTDVFVRDRLAGTTTKASARFDGNRADGDSVVPSMSADGRIVAFRSNSSDLLPGDGVDGTHIYVHDMVAGTNELISVAASGASGNGTSISVAVSEDGRYVVFTSEAFNLVTGDTNGDADIFRRDRLTATTIRVSLDSNGAQANGTSREQAVSGDGLHIAFGSHASNLVAGDTNDLADVFVRNLG